MITLSQEQKDRIRAYGWGGIGFEIDSENDVVKIKQSDPVNGYILTQKELHERAREIFPEKHIKIFPIVFSLDVSKIDTEWILEQMKAYNIKRSDLTKQLALETSYLSLLFAEKDNPRKINLSKPMKALFYYYFLTYKLNKDLREK